MEKVVKFGKVIRNNWKKSVLGVVALYYGAATVKERYEINILMRAACQEASKYGDVLIPLDRNPTHVTVILNPVANKRQAKQEFEKYCEPLLHLAGLQVDVIQTASEGNAKDIVETLKGTEAIIIAGGDGTLSETVTGLLRRNDEANRFPLGILPLGRTNSIGNTLFPNGNGSGVEKVKQLIDASMAIISGNTVWKDAIKIEPIAQEDETPSKPIFAMSSVEWGAFKDVFARQDKYWIYGSLKKYASFIFNGYKQSLCWDCSGTLRYSPPCTGCSNCTRKRPEVKTKWSFLMPRISSQTADDSTEVVNLDCAKMEELCFNTCDFRIVSPNVQNPQVPALCIAIGKRGYSYKEFVSEGWNRVKDSKIADPLLARTIELLPRKSDKEAIIEIDREEFEAKPVKITLLPKIVKLYCKPVVKDE